MISLSLMLKEMQQQISDLQTGNGGTVSFDARKIQLGQVKYHDGVPTVSMRHDNGIAYLDFTLTNPITDAKQFGVVVAESTIHHQLDRIQLDAATTTSFVISEKPNNCPVVITINGFSYLETGESDSIFTVDRNAKVITWNATKAGFVLNSNLAATIYVSYEVSKAIEKVRENIPIASIGNDTFNITNKPNSDPAVIIINGVSYFEEGNDFTINRVLSPCPVAWSSTKTGFHLDNTITGYVTIIYNIDV